jgi:hypothetical protein
LAIGFDLIRRNGNITSLLTNFNLSIMAKKKKDKKDKKDKGKKDKKGKKKKKK